MPPKDNLKYLISIDNWGPAAWNFLHAVSLTLPKNPAPEIQAKYKELFKSLTTTLPCNICQSHLQEHLAIHPVDVSSARKCSEWLYNVHNAVNVSIDKTPMYSYLTMVAMYLPPHMYHVIDPSLEEVEQLLTISPKVACSSSSYSPVVNNNNKMYVLFIVFLILVIISLIVLLCVRFNVKPNNFLKLKNIK